MVDLSKRSSACASMATLQLWRRSHAGQPAPEPALRHRERLRAYASAGGSRRHNTSRSGASKKPRRYPDAAQVSLHTILGLTYEGSPATRWGFEAYTKRWTTVVPYFDNLLDPLSLTPDLAPDRVRIVPKNSEASGLEVSVRTQFAGTIERVGNAQLVARSRRLAAITTSGEAGTSPGRDCGDCLEGSRLSLSALAGWHRGWPSTPSNSLSHPMAIPAESFSTSAIRSAGATSTRWICAAVTLAAGQWRFLGGARSHECDQPPQ